MSTLEITETKAEQFDKYETTCLQRLQDYLDGKVPGGDDIVVARTGLATVAKNRQTITAREALKYAMVNDLGDPKVRERYVKATQPEIKRLLKE